MFFNSILNTTNKKVVFLLGLLFVFPFFLLLLYANPKYDEFAFIYYTRDGYLSGIDQWLNNENGRYTNALLMCLPVLKNVFIYRMVLAVIMMLFIHSIYFVSLKVVKLKGIQAISFTLLFSAIYLLFHPYPNEGFYWFATSSHYLITTPLLFYLISFSYLSLDEEKGSKRWWGLLILQNLLVILIVGTNEMCAIIVTALVLMNFVNVKSWKNAFSLDKSSLLFTALCFDIVHVKFLQQSRLKEGKMALDLSLHNVTRAFNEALSSLISYYREWLFEDMLILLVVLVTISVIWGLKVNVKLPKPKVKLLYIGVGMILSVLLALTISNLAYFPLRALNFIIVIALFPLLIGAYYVGYNLQESYSGSIKPIKYSFVIIVSILVLQAPNLSVFQEVSGIVVLSDWYQRRDEGHWSVKDMHPMNGMEIRYYRQYKNIRIISMDKDVGLENYWFSVKPEGYYNQHIKPGTINYLPSHNMNVRWVDHKVSLLQESEFEHLTIDVYKGDSLCWSKKVKY